MRRTIALIVSLVVLSLACSLTGVRPTPTVVATSGPVPNNTVDVRPTATPLITPIVEIPGPTDTPDPTALPDPSGETPPDVIVILSPGPGSQVSGTLTVAGVAEPTFENMLGIQVVDASGQVIGNGVASIHADSNQRSPFDGTVTFTPPAQAEPGRIVVSDSSARDGHLTHLASVEVMLLPNGSAASLTTNTEQPEAIRIQTVGNSTGISRGVLYVSGQAAPAFEQTLSVAVLDESGTVVGQGTVTIQADAGQAGTFEGNITYTVTREQPGAVQVYVASARDGGITHLSSVDVTLTP